MNKQTVALIVLFAGWVLTADIANATTYEDIAGQWSGDVTDYVFAPDTLTVKFTDRPMCSRSRNTTTPTTAYVLIGSTESAKSRTRFSLSSAAARWRSRGATTNRAELSVAANLATDLEASRERLATCCQPRGNREGPTCLSVSIGRRESRPSCWLRWGAFSPSRHIR